MSYQNPMGSTIKYVRQSLSTEELAKLPHIVQFPPLCATPLNINITPASTNPAALHSILERFISVDTHTILAGQIRQHVACGVFVAGFVGLYPVLFARQHDLLNVIRTDTLESCGMFDLHGSSIYYIGDLFYISNTTTTTIYAVTINDGAVFKPLACVPLIENLELRYVAQFQN